MRPRAVFYLLSGLFLVLIAAAAAFDLPRMQEMAGYDFLMRLRPAQSESPDIVIIEISDDTLKALGRWPISRNYHAALIKALTDSGCRMIVFDVLLSEPAEGDDALAEAMRQSARVYLPYAFKIEDGRGLNVSGTIVSREVLAGTADSFSAVMAGSGQINVLIDPDGKARRIPLWVDYDGKRHPALGFLAASRHMGRSLADDSSIPLDSGALWINYPGRWVDIFRHFSYVDVLKAYSSGLGYRKPNHGPLASGLGYRKPNHGSLASGLEEESGGLDLAVFKDKICFVGLTAAGTSDLRATPLEPVYPMVGLQASVCDSILRGSFIRRLALPWRIGIACAVFILSLWICLRLFPLAAVWSCAALAGAYAFISWLFFAFRGIFADLFFPLEIIALVYVVILFRKFFAEAQKRRLLEKELEIAAQIQKSFLPLGPWNLEGARINVFLKAAKFVGGDLYDIIPLDDSCFGVFIADVSGKGVSAALIMAQAVSFFRIVSRSSRDPAEVMALLNNHLSQVLKGRFVTGQYVVVHIDEGFWEGACAGHPELLFFDKSQGLVKELLAASGMPLGLAADTAYETIRHPFSDGDKLLLYTDGWTEARDSRGREFGLERLKELFFRNRGESPDSLLSNLEAGHNAFEGVLVQHDDLTAVALEFSRRTNL